jgi:hypothetical protein
VFGDAFQRLLAVPDAEAQRIADGDADVPGRGVSEAGDAAGGQSGDDEAEAGDGRRVRVDVDAVHLA